MKLTKVERIMTSDDFSKKLNSSNYERVYFSCAGILTLRSRPKSYSNHLVSQQFPFAPVFVCPYTI